MVGVGRWLAHWPGVAGVSSSLTLMASRIGAAGLLCQLAFSTIRAPLGLSTGAGMATCLAMTALAMFSLTPAAVISSTSPSA